MKNSGMLIDSSEHDSQITFIVAILREAATIHFQITVAQKEYIFAYLDFLLETRSYID